MAIKVPIKPKQFRTIEKGLKPTELIERKSKEREEWWPAFGGSHVFDYYKPNIEKYFLERLFNISKKRKPNIMMVGVGSGLDVVRFNDFLNDLNITSNFDVFNLTNTLYDRAKKVVRKDYSQRLPLEVLGSNPEKYPDLIKDLQGKYDLLIAKLSAGYYTSYPGHSLFFMGLMLTVNGEALIDVVKARSIMIGKEKRVFQIPYKKIFFKLLELYNKQHKTNYNFEFEDLPFGKVKLKRVA